MRSTEELAPIRWRVDEAFPRRARDVLRPRRRRRLALGTLAGVVIVGAGAAVGSFAMAAWLGSGGGSATARSTTSTDSAISADAFAADLFPGAHSSVTVRVTNSNDYPVVVHSIAAGASLATPSGCPAGTVTTDARAYTATGLAQVDGTTVKIAPRSLAVYALDTRMAASAPDSCQQQSFSIPLTASLASAAG
ncbi:MAG: hypothetical protein R6X23_06260 [Acidimicrobiia bacterium]